MTESEPTHGGRQVGPHLLGVTVTWRYWLEVILVRSVVHLLFRLDVRGLEHWPDPPFQLVSNHHSGWDPMLILAVSPSRPRVTWFGPKEADFSRGFKNRVLGFFGGMIPYNPRKTNLPSSVRAVQRVFDAGGVLGITPEGTIGFRESELLPLQDGATLFASISGVPILPCAVIGSTTLWLRKSLEIRFGEPIPVARTSGRAERDALAERVRVAMAALLPAHEPALPRFRPGEFLSDAFSGRRDAERRQAHVAELDRNRRD